MAVSVLNHKSEDALERMRYEDEMLAEIEHLRSLARHNEASALHNTKD